MSIYNSLEGYAEFLCVPQSVVEERYAIMSAKYNKVLESRKCPKCGNSSLDFAVEDGKDIVGGMYVYCSTHNKEQGTSCDFRGVADKGVFEFLEPFQYDKLVRIASLYDITDDAEITEYFGKSWGAIVEEENQKLQGYEVN